MYLTKVLITVALGVMLSIHTVIASEKSAVLPDIPALDPTKVSWSELEYTASKYLMSVDAGIKFKRLSPADAGRYLAKTIPEKGDASLSTEKILLSLRTQVLGNKSETEMLMNIDSQAIQNSAYVTGLKHRYRVYRYGSDSIYRQKRYPASSRERKGGWESWSDIREHEYANPKQMPPVVTEVEALFYILSAARDLGNYSIIHSYIYDRDGIIDIALEAQGSKLIEVDFYEIASNGERNRVQKKMNATKFNVVAKPYGSSERSSKELDLVGLSGDLILWVDGKTGVVLQVDGSAKYIGDVSIRLKAVHLNGSEY